ncbi:U3-containing 90S pre-ribosomal complex subunit-domain containing protein [Phlyctochytrium arcticum]|nr:U3-containing 90S pre-ribosomal complex subunit-domain containing protein [Phlyctochytrium arcticum]
MTNVKSADALDGDDYIVDDASLGGEPEDGDLEAEFESDTEAPTGGDSIEPKDTSPAPAETPVSKKRKQDKQATAATEPKQQKPKKVKNRHGADPKTIFTEEGLECEEESNIKARGDAHYADFIKELFPGTAATHFSKTPKLPTGTPKVIILCSSAIRAVDVCRLVRKVGECRVGKLFAKHMKVKEQLELLRSHSYPIIVGTPNRVLKLIQDGNDALRLTELEYVVADYSHRDSKQRNIYDIQEVKTDYFKLLHTLRQASDSIKFHNF